MTCCMPGSNNGPVVAGFASIIVTMESIDGTFIWIKQLCSGQIIASHDVELIHKGVLRLMACGVTVL